jgi:hypothetical protein
MKFVSLISAPVHSRNSISAKMRGFTQMHSFIFSALSHALLVCNSANVFVAVQIGDIERNRTAALRLFAAFAMLFLQTVEVIGVDLPSFPGGYSGDVKPWR